jgi:hypothetical protein
VRCELESTRLMAIAMKVQALAFLWCAMVRTRVTRVGCVSAWTMPARRRTSSSPWPRAC